MRVMTILWLLVSICFYFASWDPLLNNKSSSSDDELAHKVENAKQKKQKYRAKCLMFKENRRPAYYGTWQKKSALVGPRRPFAKDEVSENKSTLRSNY